MQWASLRLEGQGVGTRGRWHGDGVERGDVPRAGLVHVLGRAGGDLRRTEGELGVVGLVGLPLLEAGYDPASVLVAGADEEMEGRPGWDWAEGYASHPVTRSIDVDCDLVVVAVAALVEARFAVREAARERNARRHDDDAEGQYRKRDDARASLVHGQFDHWIPKKEVSVYRSEVG